MILVGILYIYVGKRTANKLSDLRKSLISEEELRQKFQECDQDQSGTITKRQFKTLTDHMGLDLNRRELEAAWMFLDKEDVGEITYEEFQAWWVDWDLDDSSPGSGFGFV
jgi:Ca2+-binding EF-hand superfamily protein